jgi:hypothetical protein
MVMADFMNAKGQMQLVWLTATDCNHLQKQKHAGGILNVFVLHSILCTVLVFTRERQAGNATEPVYLKHKPHVLIL